MKMKLGIVIVTVLMLCIGCGGNFEEEENNIEIQLEGNSSLSIEETLGEEEASWTKKLMEQLDVEQDELLYERGQKEDGTDIETVLKLSEIYIGSFTEVASEEMLVLFRFRESPPHAAGFDRVIAAIFDTNTWKILAQQSFAGDKICVHLLPDEEGSNAILVLADTCTQGGMIAQNQTLYQITDGVFQGKDPISKYRRSDEYFSYDSYLSKYCVLTGENSLLIFDVAGAVNEEHQYKLEYKLRDIVHWDSYRKSYENDADSSETSGKETTIEDGTTDGASANAQEISMEV